MGWHSTADLTGFLAAADDFLRSRAVENTILLGAAETVNDGHPAAATPRGSYSTVTGR